MNIIFLCIAVVLFIIVYIFPFKIRYVINDKQFEKFCRITNISLTDNDHLLTNFSANEILNILSQHQLIKYGSMIEGNVSFYNLFKSINIFKYSIKIGNQYWMPNNKEELQKVFDYLFLYSPRSQIISSKKMKKIYNNRPVDLLLNGIKTNYKSDNIIFNINYISNNHIDDKISIVYTNIDDNEKEIFINLSLNKDSELNDNIVPLIIYFGVINNFKFNYHDDMTKLVNNISEGINIIDKLIISSDTNLKYGSILTLYTKDEISLLYEYICDIMNY